MTYLNHYSSDSVVTGVAADDYPQLPVCFPLGDGMVYRCGVHFLGAGIFVEPRQHAATHLLYETVNLHVTLATPLYFSFLFTRHNQEKYADVTGGL